MMPISCRAASRGRRVSRVERDAVAHRAAGSSRSPTCTREAGVGGAAQQPVELLDLAALALPAHPQAFAARSTAASRWNRKKRSAPPSPCLALSASMPARAAARISASSRQRLGRRRRAKSLRMREVDVRIEVAERLHFEVLEQLARRASTLSSIVGTITIVRAVAGHAASSSSRGSRRGGISVADQPLHELRSRARSPAPATSSATTTSAGAAPAVRAARRRRRPRRAAR